MFSIFDNDLTAIERNRWSDGYKQFFVFLMDKERRLTSSFRRSRVLFRENKIINAQNTSIKTSTRIVLEKS